jgi:hypothetical protein
MMSILGYCIFFALPALLLGTVWICSFFFFTFFLLCSSVWTR